MSMNGLKSPDVFKPYSFPDYTYITRESISGIEYEERLEFALNTAGTLISINGASKMGKSVLCDKVIPFNKQVSVSGVDFSNGEDFWNTIAKKVGLPLEESIKQEKVMSQSEKYENTEIYKLTKDRVIDFFVKEDKVLILDDFHYAPSEMQVKIAYHLKDAIRRNFKTIIISLPHRADAPIRNNSDLSGRLSLIDIEEWKLSDLTQIIKKGFQELGVTISENIVEKIAVESLTSPQLTQYICLSICQLLKIDTMTVKEIKEEILEKAYKYTTMNFAYSNVVDLLAKGPLTKGKPRNTYPTTLEKNLDLYQLMIESLAIDPPLMGLSVEDMIQRVNSLIVSGSKPDRQQIKNTINQMIKLTLEKDNLYKVIEYKDEKFYITEPLFLFFLRWGR